MRNEDGHIFTDIDKLRANIIEIGAFHVQLDNLFNGQKQLEDTANALFNENWREFYEFLRPGITSAVEAVMKDRLPKVFTFVPADYLIKGLPSA